MAVDLRGPRADHRGMQLELRSRRRRGVLRAGAAIWVSVGAAGCGPTPITAAAPLASTEEAAPEPEPAEVEPRRSPAQIAGDAPDEPARVAAGAECDLEPRIAELARGCERLRGVAATGTGAEPAAVAAFDGDACSVWSSGGFAPQSATLDLGAKTAVTAVLLVPEMSPPSATVHHTLEISDDGRRFQPLGQLRAPMRTGEVVELPIPGGITTRFLRVSTSESPSRVAWRDVVVLRCGAARAR